MEYRIPEDVAYKRTLDYFNGDELAASVWLKKYALRDKSEKLVESTPQQMHYRIAREILFVESEIYETDISLETIYNLIKDFKYFIPAGSPMYGIGNYFQNVSIGNCFVIGNDADSYGGIMTTDQEQVQIMKRRGGVGHDLSHLRPKGERVSNAAKTTSGLSSFISRYTKSTDEVAQDGRRGALMLSCDINHPDIEDFINCKSDRTSNQSANISVKVDDAFMYKTTVADSKEKALLKKIANNAWEYAEPGLLFWDKIISQSPADCYDEFKTISTNPCGELPLCAYDSCRLGHMNVYSYVTDPFTSRACFNKSKFKRDVILAQRIMDDMVDLELMKIVDIIGKIDSDPEHPEIKRVEKTLWLKVFYKAYKGRRTGLGLTGLADAIAAMGLKYGTPEATGFAAKITRYLAVFSYESSIMMAKYRGAFPAYDYDKEKENLYLEKIISMVPDKVYTGYIETGRRNIANLTIAPTGSVSILTGTSSGMEPVFMLEYIRKKKNGDVFEEYSVKHPTYQKYLSINSKDKVPDPYIGATAMDIDVDSKILMQGKLQEYIDHSISVTHNVPKNYPKDKIEDLIFLAWKCGCKGFTMYRDGSRSGILTSKDAVEEHFEYMDAVKRPKSLDCNIHITSVNGKQWIVLIGLLREKPFEVFAFLNDNYGLKEGTGTIIKVKSGVYSLETKDAVIEDIIQLFGRPEEEFITRLISSNLRHRTDIRFVCEQLVKAPGNVTDFSKSIARVLKKYVKDSEMKTKSKCTECGSDLEFQGGCLVCKNCGFSKCD